MRRKRMAILGGILVVCLCCVWSYVRAGDLNPPGTPTGTMRTLNEIYAAAFEPVKVPAVGTLTSEDAFLQVTGIPGDSMSVGHENWIEIYGFTLHMENGADYKGNPFPKFSNLLISKRLDSASVPLMKLACLNEPVSEVVLERTKAGMSPFVYYRLTLYNPRVTYLSPMSATTAGAEVASFGGFTKIRWEFRKQNLDGTAGPWQSQEWDLAKQGGES